MIIGKLRHRLELQSATDSTDSYGQPTRTWATYATVWGSIEPMSASEGPLADQLQGAISHLVTVRYNSTLAVEHRIKFGTRYFNVVGVRDFEERGIYQEIDAKENV